jgi:hypothetical protein
MRIRGASASAMEASHCPAAKPRRAACAAGLMLAFRRARYGAFDPDTVTGADIGTDPKDTYAVALGDVDGDGDLDLVEGNVANQRNRLYLNNGTPTGITNPFDGVTGVDVTADAGNTRAVALGDVDGDGELDVVAGNRGQPDRLYVARLHDTARGTATSASLAPDLRRVARVTLTADATLPPNTALDWHVTVDGGIRWHPVRSGVPLELPDDAQGTDLRWRAALRSLSPARSPRIDSPTVLAEFDADGDGLLDSTDGDDDDGASDTYERANGLDPYIDDAGDDLDDDGLSNLEEFHLGTRADRDEADRDGLNDGDEVAAGRDPTLSEPAILLIIDGLLLGED